MSKKVRAAESENLVNYDKNSDSGQALSEYLILVFLVALVCIPVAKLLPAAIIEYVRPFYYCLSRPIP